MSDGHSEYQTSEKVTIDFEIAGLPIRFAAYILDTMIKYLSFFIVYIILIITLPGGAFLMETFSSKSPAGWIVMGIGVIFILAYVILFIFYNIIFESLWKGQTPGKKIVKLRVIHDDGTYISFLSVLLRNVFKIVDFLPVYFITGFITMLINKQNKRLGDLVAGTIVVKERKVRLPDFKETEGPDYFAHIKNLHEIFTDNEKNIFLSYYNSKKDLSHEAIIKIEQKLLTIIETKTAVRRPANLTKEEFISALVTKFFKDTK